MGPQLDRLEKNLEDTHTKLARLRGRETVKASKNLTNGREEVKVERRSTSPTKMKISVDNLKAARRPPSPLLKNGDCSQKQVQSKPPLMVSGPSTSQPINKKEYGNKFSSCSGSLPSSSSPTHTNSHAKLKGDKARRISSEQGTVETQPKGTKRKLGTISLLNLCHLWNFYHFGSESHLLLSSERDNHIFLYDIYLSLLIIDDCFCLITEEREHTDLIPLIGKSSSPHTIRCQTGCLLSSQHKRKLRSLILCPSNDQLFVTR